MKRLLVLVWISLLLIHHVDCIYAAIYKLPKHSSLDESWIFTLGGEVLCGSNQDTLLIEFPNNLTIVDLQRFFPQIRWIASSAYDLLGAEPSNIDETDTYRTWSTILTELAQYQTQYPNCFQLDTIGFTVQNRPILHGKIADSVILQRDVPKLYLVAGTHGNEIISVEVLLNFVQWILNQTLTDTTIQRLLQQTEIHFIPVLNPDGYVIQQRQNARMVDLNRNFNYYWGQFANQYGSSPLSEPETFALDSLLRVIQPTLGISYHSYGEQILRPYSGRSRPSPSNPIFQNVSNLYWLHNPSYTQMFGWQLYLHGGEHNDHCISMHWLPSITIEVWRGPNYNPPVDSIASVSIPHRNAIVQLLQRITQEQVTGIVRDAHTGLPIFNAQYQILNQFDSSYALKYVNPQTGRFRSLQIASSITIRFQAEGYLTRDVTFSIPQNGQPFEQDVLLFTSSAFLSGNITLYSPQQHDTVQIRIQNQIHYIRSNEDFLLSNLLAGTDTVVIGDSMTTELIKIPIQLVSSETTQVTANIAKLLPPIHLSGRWEQGIAIIQWQSPFNSEAANSRIRGYRIWRDTTMIIPWSLDTSFAEPMSYDTRVYFVQTLYYGGISPFSDSIRVESPFTSLKNNDRQPKEYVLKPYPNPFNQSIEIEIYSPTSSWFTMKVHNLLGQLTYEKSFLSSTGKHTIKWYPSDSKHSAGIYFLTIISSYNKYQYKLVYLP